MTETTSETASAEQRLRVSGRLLEAAELFRSAAESTLPARIEEAAAVVVNAFVKGRKLLVFGNGGSASDAQHLCGELVVRFQINRRPLPAIALCSDVAVMTACGNDFSYDHVFQRQIEALGNEGDVAIGISTSGNSPNVVTGLREARRKGLTTILITGTGEGKAVRFSDIVVAAPGQNTARIQELHLASYHALCELIEERFLGEER